MEKDIKVRAFPDLSRVALVHLPHAIQPLPIRGLERGDGQGKARGSGRFDFHLVLCHAFNGSGDDSAAFQADFRGAAQSCLSPNENDQKKNRGLRDRSCGAV
jgi:hypothetical protein